MLNNENHSKYRVNPDRLYYVFFNHRLLQFLKLENSHHKYYLPRNLQLIVFYTDDYFLRNILLGTIFDHKKRLKMSVCNFICKQLN